MASASGAKDPLEAARSLFEGERGTGTAGHPAARFVQSYVGYIAWDLVHAIEKVPGWGPRVTSPLARFFGGATIVVFDGLSHTVTIAAERRGRRGARARRTSIECRRSRRWRCPTGRASPRTSQVDVDDASYMAMVRRAQEYIAAGDAFQIVLARQFRVPRAGRDPFDVYRAMRVLNPSPYMYFLDLPPAPGRANADADRRGEPRDAGAPRGRDDDRAPARRDAAAAARRPRRTRPSRASCSRTRRSAPST